MSTGAPIPVNVGDVLASKYRVDAVLGVGGMGVVVAATHLDLEQKVALKFLLPETAGDPQLVERFVREARASVRLKSPHVARTLDTGRLEDGCPYIVMEFLEGRDLDAELNARGALPVEEAATFGLQVCDALAEAHGLGIVHRDLKPANLFLTRGHDGRQQVKVLDFGISKLRDGGGEQGSVTTTEAVFGSPAYMSPEQMRSAKNVDARADIWSFGVILYEFVTGRLPFEAPTALALGLKASQEEPASPRTLRPELPEELETIILRCLAKAPDDRFPNVSELASVLALHAPPRERALAERIAEVAGRASGGPVERPSGDALSIVPRMPSRGIGLATTEAAVTKATSPARETTRSRWFLAAFGFVFLAGISAFVAVRLRSPSAVHDDHAFQTGSNAPSAEATEASSELATAASSATGASPESVPTAPALPDASAKMTVGNGARPQPTGRPPAKTPVHPVASISAVPDPPKTAAKSTSDVKTGESDAGRYFKVRE